MSILNFKKISIKIFLTSFAITCGIIASLSFENSFAHNFSPDESAEFLTIVDKIKVESAIVANSSANNNQSSAISHAQYALNTYDSHTNDELSEKNERIATELNNTLNQLRDQVETSSITDKSQINQIVETINAILEEAISVRIDDDQLNNSTIQALVFADIVNTALQSYGTAFDIGIDLTNMSNMNAIPSIGNNTIDNEHNNHELQNTTEQMSIVNFSSYESALSFADYALKKFNSDIKTSIPGNNTKTQNFLKQLENGLLEFNTAIKNHENPMKVMKIVHTKIHPNLQVLFNLKLN
jgi:flagellar basal body-associated protein FliL